MLTNGKAFLCLCENEFVFLFINKMWYIYCIIIFHVSAYSSANIFLCSVNSKQAFRGDTWNNIFMAHGCLENRKLSINTTTVVIINVFLVSVRWSHSVRHAARIRWPGRGGGLLRGTQLRLVSIPFPLTASWRTDKYKIYIYSSQHTELIRAMWHSYSICSI